MSEPEIPLMVSFNPSPITGPGMLQATAIKRSVNARNQREPAASQQVNHASAAQTTPTAAACQRLSSTKPPRTLRSVEICCAVVRADQNCAGGGALPASFAHQHADATPAGEPVAGVQL